MKYLQVLSLASAAWATTQIDFSGLGGDGVQYYKGMNIAAQQPITQNSSSGFKNYDDWEYAFGRLRNMTGGFNAVRVYSTQDFSTSWNATINHLDNIFPLALKHELNLLLGIYLDSGPDYINYSGQDRFKAEFAVLQQAVANYTDQGILNNIVGITVGNEDVYSNWTLPETIAAEISQVKNWLEKEVNDACIPVGHTDTWNALILPESGPITKASDFLLANVFPYWEHVSINQARNQFAHDISILANFSKINDGIPIWIGETGWPHIGGEEAASYPETVPSPANMQMYWTQVGCEVLNNMNSFYYIDEDALQGPVKPTWGLWDNGQPVIDFSCNGTKLLT